MKTPAPFSVTFLVLSLLLVFVAALAVRSSSFAPGASTPAANESRATTAVPDFSSATFSDGDALKGLGADWTYLEQTLLSPNTKPLLEGLLDTRVSQIKVNGKDIQLRLTESAIVDQQALQESLHRSDVKAQRIAGRDGYLVSNGFLLVGNTTTLFVQADATTPWPSELSPEALSYIATVHVP